MSDQPLPQKPNERALMSLARARASRLGKHRTAILAGAGVAALMAGSWFMHWEGQKAKPIYRGQPAPPAPYEAPVIVHAAAAAPAKPLPPPPATTPAQAPSATTPAATQAAVPPPPSISSVGYRLTQLPDYMKPKAAAPEPPHSGITQKGTTYTANMAFAMPHPEYMLRQFSKIPCILDTRVITGVGGLNPFTCHVPNPGVFSSAHVLLLDPGTVIGGFYQSVVTEGDSRVVMASATATTPNNVVVPLTGDPIADVSGAAGVEGDVNNYWMRRIGGALILALTDELFSLAQSSFQGGNGNNTLNIGNLSGSTSSLGNVAQSLLSKEMQIPPTITLNPGTVVTFWTTKEFTDFSQVYGLQPVH